MAHGGRLKCKFHKHNTLNPKFKFFYLDAIIVVVHPCCSIIISYNLLNDERAFIYVLRVRKPGYMILGRYVAFYHFCRIQTLLRYKNPQFILFVGTHALSTDFYNRRD